MHPRILFNWLVPPLRPLERKILSAVEAKLSPSLTHVFNAQVREINYVQRRQGGREVGLYVISGGRVARDESLKLPMAGREWRLARVRLAKGGAKWIATVHVVDGHLSSIEYEAAPPTKGDDADDFSVSVEVLDAPLRAPQSSGRVPTLPEWLQPYADRLGVTRIEPPLILADGAAIVDRFETTLPADYIDFIKTCDGVQIGSLSLSGLRDAYETRVVDDEYIVLAELGGKGALAVRKPGPTTVFMDYEDGSITELGRSFRAAIQQMMAP